MTVHTVGHSTRTFDELVALLASAGVKTLVDVRSFPGSRKCPWFSKSRLGMSLPGRGIEYVHLPELGGFRRSHHESRNRTWRNTSFRAYADWMETPGFNHGLADLIELATAKPTAFMCAETLWTDRHRSMIADKLKSMGWDVRHLIDANHCRPHPYTTPARIEDGVLTYRDSFPYTPTLPGF